ncbi:MAG: hypothetical protein DRH24_02085 [Deltaproteobacteria bacterium]|nr:MAG: hypothetical protein DRH24_02085 [Deltaproteobacteria bacterium]
MKFFHCPVPISVITRKPTGFTASKSKAFQSTINSKIRTIKMESIRNLLRKTAFHSFLFGIALGLFSWPILALTVENSGITTFIYLFLLWGIIILLLFMMARSLK